MTYNKLIYVTSVSKFIFIVLFHNIRTLVTKVTSGESE